MGNQKSCCVHNDHPVRHKYFIDGQQINCVNGSLSASHSQSEHSGFGRLLRRVRRAGSQCSDEEFKNTHRGIVTGDPPRGIANF